MDGIVDKMPSVTRVGQLLLAALVFTGSLLLVAIPLGWLWLIAQLDQPYMTVYFLALVGCPTMTIAWAIVLLSLNRLYLRLAGGDSGNRLLEASISIAVALAVVMLVAWLLIAEGGGPVQGPWPG
jgi:hypothetical protein